MKKSLLMGALVVILLASLFILTGCGENKTESNKGTNTSTSSETPVDTSNAAVQATEFYVQNSFPNDTTIKEIYATCTGFDSWTPNLISGLELAPGTRAKIGVGLTATTTNWDFKLVDQEGTAVTFSSVDLSAILSGTAGTVEFTVDASGDIAANVK